jgi:hypothetical protein
MRTSNITAIAVAGAIAFGAYSTALRAQAARSYTWYAQLASVDQSAKTITVTIQTRESVGLYVGGYKAGDKLMLTWVPIKNESDTVIYAPKYEVMKGIDEGYILPADFVSADVNAHTMTVKVAATDAVLQSVRSIQPAQWIKVVTPMQQPTQVAALTSAAGSTKPDLKPPPPPAAPPAQAGRGRGRGQAAAGDAPTGGGSVAGTWTVSAQLGGNPVNSECTFTLEGTKIAGSCNLGRGKADVSGEVTGSDIHFSYNVNTNGMSLDFVYTGTIDAAANTMKGTVTVYGMTSDFTATKK